MASMCHVFLLITLRDFCQYYQVELKLITQSKLTNVMSS